jgi:hypothetical protein
MRPLAVLLLFLPLLVTGQANEKKSIDSLKAVLQINWMKYDALFQDFSVKHKSLIDNLDFLSNEIGLLNQPTKRNATGMVNAPNQKAKLDSLQGALKKNSIVYNSLFQSLAEKHKSLILDIENQTKEIDKSQQQEKNIEPKQVAELSPTQIQVDQEMHLFGTIIDGQKVSHVFRITNIGAYPLVIKDTKTTCGCTVPEWPREPILPGKVAEINVTFNSEGKGLPGGLEMVKKVTIIANTDPIETHLSMRGFVTK